MFQKYRQMSKEEKEKGVGAIYVIGLICMVLLLVLTSVFAAIGYINNMISILHNAMDIAGRQTLNQINIADIQGGQVLVDQADAEQIFQTILPKYLSKWSQSSYSVQSFQVFSESDRDKPAPPGFTGIVPGTSAFITMNLQLTVLPGLLPANLTTWIFPVKDTVTPNTYHAPDGAWNPVRQGSS